MYHCDYLHYLLSLSVNLEHYAARNIMATDPLTVNVVENVQKIAGLLLNTPHGGYPVVKNHSQIFFGFIHRFVCCLQSIGFGTGIYNMILLTPKPT